MLLYEHLLGLSKIGFKMCDFRGIDENSTERGNTALANSKYKMVSVGHVFTVAPFAIFQEIFSKQDRVTLVVENELDGWTGKRERKEL